MRNHVLAAALLSTIAAFAMQPASASLIVEEKGGSTGTLIVNNACDGQVDGPANQLVGCLQNDHTTAAFFDNPDEFIVFDAGGQARVEADDGLFDFLQISLENPFNLDTLIVNILADIDGTVSFATSDSDISALFPLDGNGENFFTLTMDPAVDWVSFTTNDQIILSSRQWRIALDEGDPPQIPEPGTLAMLGAGLIGLALMRRRQPKG